MTFHKTEVIDKVTGKVISETWSGSQNFPDVSSPSLSGYTVDRTVVSDPNITYDHGDVVENVTYTAIPQPGKGNSTGGTSQVDNHGGSVNNPVNNPAGSETTNQVVNGNQNTNKTVTNAVNQSELVNNSVPSVGAIQTHAGKQNSSTAKLPQTGDRRSSLATAGLGMLGLTWLFGLFGKRKHN